VKQKNGDKNPNWKGGITSLVKRIRKLDKYKEWRNLVFIRDDFTCEKCLIRGNGDLNAHHIKEFAKIIKENEIKTIEEAENCGELWNVGNGQTFCKKCHKEKHKKGEKNLCGIWNV